jgi:uncharacterized protein
MHDDNPSRIDAPTGREAVADVAPFQAPTVVHSSYGRLRVHLPHWSGARAEIIAAGVCRLRGVTYAKANPLTGNLLILFESGPTTAPALLEALPALRLEPPVSPPLLDGDGDARAAETRWHLMVPDQSQEPDQGYPVVYVTGPMAVVYKALGWTSVGMAVVGAILPGIPTAPFVILAGYFFVRSSPEAHAWLRRARWFGPMLRDWEMHRGVRRSVRNAALALIGGGMVITALLGLPASLTVTIIACQVVGMAIVLRLRVVAPVALAPVQLSA